MSLSVVFSRAKLGINAPTVSIETHISNGLPSLSIVGMPETSVRESKDRVRSALLNSGFEFSAKRITINLAPADVPKEGSRFDLPIAIGLLAASEQIASEHLRDVEVFGELALSGEVKATDGILPAVMAAKKAQRKVILPMENYPTASRVDQVELIPVRHLMDAIQYLTDQTKVAIPKENTDTITTKNAPDMCEVNGQTQAKRALEIAAAGGHHTLLFGPPGTGKTLLASRLSSILPPLSNEQSLEVLALESLVSANASTTPWLARPFQNPHHTASAPALIGGGTRPKPGAVSLAHNGVLFLDELPEFQRRVIEVLRQPLESGEVSIARANQQIRFPARFQLVAAMNPCPCGHYGNKQNLCRCTPDQIRRYLNKISGPFLDRIDLHVELPLLSNDEIFQTNSHQETSADIRERVIKARQIQIDRNQNRLNSELDKTQIDGILTASPDIRSFLSEVLEKLKLSPRVIHRVIKVAQTIADLNNENRLEKQHIAEALNMRKLERYLANL
ncbi:MAG: YifB family Mg chelatase-like AAA ATPase [Pseudomonadota bacterium]